MLILSRKVGQRILVGEVVLSVLEIRGNVVNLGFTAPRDLPILREELAGAAAGALPGVVLDRLDPAFDGTPLDFGDS